MGQLSPDPKTRASFVLTAAALGIDPEELPDRIVWFDIMRGRCGDRKFDPITELRAEAKINPIGLVIIDTFDALYGANMRLDHGSPRKIPLPRGLQIRFKESL
ncbi:MAG: hypothetical protein M3Z96_09455 [Pseudomonadota bacterium]|nr:hypothetical protein [Pseudomonadota bacterium]